MARRELDRARHWLARQLVGACTEALTVDARSLPYLTKISQKIITFAKNPRLNLKNSPPFLQGIMLDDLDLLNAIFKKNSIESLKTNDYFTRFLECFIRHGKRTIRLFKESGTHMEEEGSKWRRELNKYTLVFSHILAELRAYFKEGVWTDFRIAKIEAREFWEKSFPRR